MKRIFLSILMCLLPLAIASTLSIDDFRTALSEGRAADAETAVAEMDPLRLDVAYAWVLGLTNYGDYDVAALGLAILARRGHAPSQMKLGWLASKGYGVAPDPEEALFWADLALATDPDTAIANAWVEEVRERLDEDRLSAVAARVDAWRPDENGVTVETAPAPTPASKDTLKQLRRACKSRKRRDECLELFSTVPESQWRERVSDPRVDEETQVEPVYSELAEREGAVGTVTLRAHITREGDVAEITVLRCTATGYDFEEAAIAAVSQWKYDPAAIYAQPIDVDVVITVPFAPE